MNDERRKIKALKDDELLALFCEICEGSYPIEDGATYTEADMYAAVREEILKRMARGKANQESESELFDIYCKAHA